MILGTFSHTCWPFVFSLDNFYSNLLPIFLVMGTFKIYSLSNIQIYKTILLIIVTMLYITYLSYNWKFVLFNHFYPFCQKIAGSYGSSIFIYLFFNIIFYCSSTVVSISPHHSPPPYPPPPPNLNPSPLWLCPCVLYTCSLMILPFLSFIIPFPPPLWLLSVCSLLQRLWLYFACLFVLLIMFHL